MRRKDSPDRERERERKPRVADIYDKREDMLRRKRQANIESKLTEVETQRMIDECVNKRIKELMEKKDAEVDAEVCRRVENAKQILERQMREELQAKKAEMDREMAEQEVGLFILLMATFSIEMLSSCTRAVLASNLVSIVLVTLPAS